jgi:peptidoglycan/xylan/chitin deacetylase (PgdA/CDA1 family)
MIATFLFVSNDDSLDWQDLTANDIYNRVIQKTKNGSIILFHNAAKNTPEALPKILEKLKKDGYEFVKINDLIYKKDYYIDNTGKQIKKPKS